MNSALQRKVDELHVRLALTDAMALENAELKALMGRASTSEFVIAAVLKRPPLSIYDELIIDLGSEDGVTVGQTVYSVGQISLGRVVDVFDNTARVKLFSSPDETVDVFVGPFRSPATAKGRGGGQYKAELPRDIIVSEGDPVTIPAINDSVFGTVTAVLSSPTEPFQSIIFAPPVNIFEIRWVLLKR